MTTPLSLAAVRELCEKATPGPWRECASEVLIGDHWWRPALWAHYRNDEDAAFIAASRTVVPHLLSDVDRLRAAILRTRQILGDWSDLSKAHEYGCGNSRPCDACELDAVLNAALSPAEVEK